MAKLTKLIFEDEEGKQHDLQIKNIPSTTIREDQVFIVDCEIGDANMELTRNYLNKVSDLMKLNFPDQKILTFAMRNGKKDINLKIVKEK